MQIVPIEIFGGEILQLRVVFRLIAFLKAQRHHLVFVAQVLLLAYFQLHPNHLPGLMRQ